MPGTATRHLSGQFLFAAPLPTPMVSSIVISPAAAVKTTSPFFPVSFLLTLPILPTHSVVRVCEQKLHFAQRREKVEGEVRCKRSHTT